MFMDLIHEELGNSKDSGKDTRFNCPFCGEDDHKFYVRKDAPHIWRCFKCPEKGNAVSFVMKFYQVSYPDAVDILETYDYDVELYQNNDFAAVSGARPDLSPEEQLLLYISHMSNPIEEESNIKLRCPKVPPTCKSLIANWNNPEAFPFFAYLHSRGVTPEHIQQHSISYIVDDLLELPSYDGREKRAMRIKNHVVFFTKDNEGNPIYWNTRSIDPNPFVKSINAPSTPEEYSKNNTVFNLNNAKYADKIVIHEGVFDSFMTPGCGVATFGKQITQAQLELLLSETKERKLPIYLYLDTDAWKEMIDTKNRIKALEPDRLVFYVYSGSDDDANKLGVAKVSDLISNAFIADAASDVKLELLNYV
ncbi:DNA primase [Bacillus phage 010DV004]|nr:DNA primase [Bacillus phage 010DV004]QZA69382.1 DNA primase [Bacillus phage 010DV005]